MTPREISTAAIDGYLRLIRIPIDGAVRLLGDDRPRATGARLAVDRVDAGVRGFAGLVLGSDELREEARRRRVAADERARAQALREQASERSEQADERLVDTIGAAQRRRQATAARAQQKRRAAAEQRADTSRRVSAAESRRKAATRKAAAGKQEAVESRAKKARLEQLDRTSEVLAEKERALTVADEARRLDAAAGTAKAARKRSD